MAQMILVMIGISVLGFIFGLAGKAWAVKKHLRRKSEFFTRITVLFIILMFLLVIVYQFYN